MTVTTKSPPKSSDEGRKLTGSGERQLSSHRSGKARRGSSASADEGTPGDGDQSRESGAAIAGPSRHLFDGDHSARRGVSELSVCRKEGG